MTEHEFRWTEHEILVELDSAELFRLLADVENWPQIFQPAIYVERREQAGEEERLRVWAAAGGELRSWTQRRRLFPAARRIDFWEDDTALPVTELRGTWIIEPAGPRLTRLRLRHEYRPADGQLPETGAIAESIDRNCRNELPALKSAAEAAARTSGLALTVSDTISVDGPARAIYEFLRTALDAAHGDESVRVCLPGRVIACKRTTVPPLMTSHAVRWEVAGQSGGTTRASGRHSVIVNPDAVTEVLGETARVPDAREFLRNVLGDESRTLLGQAKAHAERRR